MSGTGSNINRNHSVCCSKALPRFVHRIQSTVHGEQKLLEFWVTIIMKKTHIHQQFLRRKFGVGCPSSFQVWLKKKKKAIGTNVGASPYFDLKNEKGWGNQKQNIVVETMMLVNTLTDTRIFLTDLKMVGATQPKRCILKYWLLVLWEEEATANLDLTFRPLSGGLAQRIWEAISDPTVTELLY